MALECPECGKQSMVEVGQKEEEYPDWISAGVADLITGNEPTTKVNKKVFKCVNCGHKREMKHP